MTKVSNETDTLAIDSSNPQFAEIVKLFEVKSSPFVIFFNEGSAIVKEAPNDNTVRKIQAFNRINKDAPAPNPATVQQVQLAPKPAPQT
jgi:hypothetical protein